MKLTAGICKEDVKSAYDKEKNGKIKQRLLIILKTFKEKSSYKIAEQVGTTHTKVQRWINRFNKHGFDGLKDKPRSGAPSRLSTAQIQELDIELSRKKEFSVGWRTLEVANKVKDLFGVKYTMFHIRRILKKLEYSRVKPRPSHVRKDPIKSKNIVEKIKKNSFVWVKTGTSLHKMSSQ